MAYEYSVFTRTELDLLHKQFGHLFTEDLPNLLKRANQNDIPPETLATLKDISSRCQPFQTWAPRSARFHVSMPLDNTVFNNEMEVDLFCIESTPSLHIIDSGTWYPLQNLCLVGLIPRNL